MGKEKFSVWYFHMALWLHAVKQYCKWEMSVGKTSLKVNHQKIPREISSKLTCNKRRNEKSFSWSFETFHSGAKFLVSYFFTLLLTFNQKSFCIFSGLSLIVKFVEGSPTHTRVLWRLPTPTDRSIHVTFGDKLVWDWLLMENPSYINSLSRRFISNFWSHLRIKGKHLFKVNLMGTANTFSDYSQRFCLLKVYGINRYG